MTVASRTGDRVLDRGDEHNQGLASRVVDQQEPWAEEFAPVTGVKLVSTAGPAAAPLQTRLRPAVAHGAVILIATIGALWSLPRLGPGDLGPLGLASSLPLLTYLALAALLIGFSVASVRHNSTGLLGAYVTVTTALMHSLGPIVYANLRFPWAWKHVGIVDFIQRTGGVDPTIESLKVYHNWPGFFGLSALFTDTSGMTTALSFAAWTPVLFNLLYLAALFVIFRTFTLDERIIWTGLMFFAVANWVGQDYFSPQAVAFLFYLVAVAILLRWFPVDRSTPRHLAGDLESTIAAAVLFLVLAAMVVTHQLTPVMMMVAVAGLAIFRRTRLRWPVFVIFGLLTVWMVGFARPFLDEYLPRIIADLGELGSRVDSGLIDYGQVDTSQRLVSIAVRGLTGSVVLLALLGYLRSFRTGIRWRSAIILSLSPLVLVGASSYGDEILFRAFLFILPMAALFTGALWFSREPVRGRVTIATLALALILLGFLSIVARHGNDVRTVFSDDEVAAAALLYEDAPPGSAVIQLSVSYATKFSNYENLTELSVSTFSLAAKERLLADPASVFSEWLTEGHFTAGYVLITRSQGAEIARNGLLPLNSPAAIANDLRASDAFDVIFDSSDGVLFRLRDTA